MDSTSKLWHWEESPRQRRMGAKGRHDQVHPRVPAWFLLFPAAIPLPLANSTYA